MRYLFFFCLLLCSMLVNAKEYESFPTNYPSGISTPYWEIKDRMNLQNGYEQTIYWKKYKKLKKYAFGVLGLGVCGTIVGWIGETGNSAYTNGNWKDDGKVWDAILGIGLGLTVSSIPLFVISYKNKKKAKSSMEFSLSSSTIYERITNGKELAQPALGICVNF